MSNTMKNACATLYRHGDNGWNPDATMTWETEANLIAAALIVIDESGGERTPRLTAAGREVGKIRAEQVERARTGSRTGRRK